MGRGKNQIMDQDANRQQANDYSVGAVNDDQVDLSDADYNSRKKRACDKFAPNDEAQFKLLFLRWVREFHYRWLQHESKNSTVFQKNLFFVKHNNYEEKMNPDMAGSLTKSLIDAAKILNYETN